MHHTNHDGAALAAACVAPGVSPCTVCGGPLTGAEPFWLTDFPRGEHTRCRRWRGLPYPFLRQVGVLRRLWRTTTSPDARQLILEAGRWLSAEASRWNEAASAEMVLTSLARMRALRLELMEYELDRKLLGQL